MTASSCRRCPRVSIAAMRSPMEMLPKLQQLYRTKFRDPRNAVETLFAGLSPPVKCPARSATRKNPSMSRLGLEIARLVNHG